MTSPLVSIGMPVYNEEPYIGQALEALLNQDFTDFELIISDNASTDGTGAICLHYASRDHRIRYHRNETNVGGLDNFNLVYKSSRGEYFMWAGAHDSWHPEFLSRCAEVLGKDPQVVLCYPQAVLIDQEGRPLGPMPQSLDTRTFDVMSRFTLTIWGLVNGNHVYGLMRASALRRTRLLQKLFAPDLVLLAELSLLGPFAQVPEPLFYRRRVRDQETRDQRIGRWIESLRLRGRSRRVWFPHWRLGWEYARIAMRAPVGLRWKGPLLAIALFSWAVRYNRGLLHDLRHGFGY